MAGNILSKPEWKRRLFNALRILVSLVLIVSVIRLADGTQIVSALSGANLLYIALVAVIANLERLLVAYKWNLLLRVKGIQLPLINVVSSFYKSTFLGMLFLPTVGADAMRIVEISQQTRRSHDIISSVVVERFLGLLAVAFVGIVGLLLFTFYIGQRRWGILINLTALFLITGALLIASLKASWLIRLGKRLPYDRWRIYTKLEQVMVSYQEYARYRWTLLAFFLLSVLDQFSPIINSFSVSRAFNLDVPCLYFFIFVPIIMIVIRLPISFDGFGVREGLYVYLFGLVGVSQPDAFLIGFITSLVFRFAVTPLTLYFFLVKREAPQSEATVAETPPAGEAEGGSLILEE